MSGGVDSLNVASAAAIAFYLLGRGSTAAKNGSEAQPGG